MNPLLNQFLSESRDFSEDIGAKLMQLENAPDDQTIIDELFRLVHTLKGNSGLFTFPEMTRVLHAGEDLLGMVRNGQLAYSRQLADRLLDGIDLVMVMCGDIESTGKIDLSRTQGSADMVESLRDLLPSVRDLAGLGGAVEAGVSGSPSTGAAIVHVKVPPLAEIPEATRMDAFRRSHGGESLNWITYTPARECFFQGDDPFYLVRQVPGILWGSTQPLERLPTLAELDTYSCVLEFHLLTTALPEELSEHFRYVPDQVSIVQVDPIWLVIPLGRIEGGPAHHAFTAKALGYLEKNNLDTLRDYTTKSLKTEIAGSWQVSALRWLLVLLESRPDQRAALRLLIQSFDGAKTPDWTASNRDDEAQAKASATQFESGIKRGDECRKGERQSLSDTPSPDLEEQAIARETILETQRQILQLVDHPAWETGRIRAVAAVLRNLWMSAGNGQASSEIDAAISASLAVRENAPLLKWLEENKKGMVGLLPQPGATSLRDGNSTSGPAETATTVRPSSARPAGDEAIKFGRRAEDAVNGQRSVKVDQAKIDRLMNLIGELVVEKNALPYLALRAETQYGVRELSREIKAQYSVINRIADEMQDAIMQVRMMSVSFVFQRFPRLVRDISRKLGKEVQLVLEGEQTEADKNIIESLADPLIHIVRNSLDHGLETPDVRRASGKPETGTLTIRAAQEADRVVIEISDDGKGIDPTVIKRKAYEKGLIDEAALERIDDQEAVNLIFAAGLSTAAVVSDLSGRGVGMDVVRSAVEKMNGTVMVNSEVGKGTKIRISLPLSMAVTQVMIVESDQQLFGIPLDHVIETVRVAKTAIRFIKQSMTAVLRGRVVPLKAINGLLGISARAKVNEDDEFAVLLVQVGGEVLGLVVDSFRETIGVIQKPLNGFLSGLSAYSGSALMGDGSVLMILNIRELV
jgi:two-component system chemotaxis sensor kinase CheA